MKARASALLSGLLFGAGLCLSGMTEPRNILAFLDVTGAWSANLAGVMFGAIAVHASWLWWSARGDGAKARTASASLPASGGIDGALLGGAALFGVGWGLSGYCPGPAIVALASGARGTFVFVLAMLLGMALGERFGDHLAHARSPRLIANESDNG